MSTNTLISIAQSLAHMEHNARILALYRTDTPGTEYLKTYAPHLMSQLDEYTMNWVLVPKAILFNEDSLHNFIEIYRSNMEYALPELPPEVSKEDYQALMKRLFDFLETEVAPVIAKMPVEEVEKEDVADEFTEPDFGGDADGFEGEEPSEASNP